MNISISLTELKQKSTWIRQQIMKIGYETQSGHLSSALSIVELVVALYYGGLLNINKDTYIESNRNRFILSKGHACIILYIILADLGILPEEELYHFCKPEGILGAHPDCLKLPGIETTTGALGHGLAFGIGDALAAKYKREERNVYVLLGDGESQEGSVWESALFAGNNKLDNLTVIIDYNKLQASGYTEDISGLYPLAEKWSAFGFTVCEIDGHEMDQVLEAYHTPHEGRPLAIIANTVKGKGVSMIENQNGWHGRKPNDREWEILKKELFV